MRGVFATPLAAVAATSKVAAVVEECKLVAPQYKGKKKTGTEPEPEPTAT